MRASKPLAIAAGLFTGVIVVGAVVSFADSAKPDEPTTVASSETTREASERNDLDFLKMDDRSTSWVTDIWLVWEITNNSSEKSDYTFEWEAIDTTTNKRVDDGFEFENSVRPGQTISGDTFTSLDTAKNIKINITDFERTSSSSW